MVSQYRRVVNRCKSIKTETKGRYRTSQCQLVAGHTDRHISYSGHRTWTDDPPIQSDNLQLQLDLADTDRKEDA